MQLCVYGVNNFKYIFFLPSKNKTAYGLGIVLDFRVYTCTVQQYSVKYTQICPFDVADNITAPAAAMSPRLKMSMSDGPEGVSF